MDKYGISCQFEDSLRRETRIVKEGNIFTNNKCLKISSTGIVTRIFLPLGVFFEHVNGKVLRWKFIVVKGISKGRNTIGRIVRDQVDYKLIGRLYTLTVTQVDFLL